MTLLAFNRLILKLAFVVCFLSTLRSVARNTVDSRLLKEEQNEVENNIDIQNDSNKNNGNNKDITPDEQLKRNSKIKEKYEVISELMSEILPGINENNRTESYFKFLKKFKRQKRKRRIQQKKCKRKNTILERWLTRQLSFVQKAASNSQKSCYRAKKKKKNETVTSDEIGDEELQSEIENYFREESEEQDDNKQDGEISKRRVIARYCNAKGSKEEDGTLKLCTECYVQHDLGPRRYPRYLNEIECGMLWPTDYFCLSNEGVCASKNIFITFRYDKNNQGLSKLYEWEEYLQPVHVGCNCQISGNSVFKYFI